MEEAVVPNRVPKLQNRDDVELWLPSLWARFGLREISFELFSVIGIWNNEKSST